MKPRFTICLIVSLLLAIVISVQATEWPMYRHDPKRTGKADSGAFTNTRPVPIWVFPVPETGVAPVDNDVIEPIVDVNGTVVKDSPNFTMTGQWLGADSTVSPNAYQGNYLYAFGGSGATATWEFRLANQKGWMVAYYVYIWFPSHADASEPPHAENAPYTVEIVNDDGSVAFTDRFEVDQTSGGNWTVLTSRPYMVRDDQWIRVTLSADDVDADKIVCADGVSLDQDLGSVLSSPALATNDAALRDDDLVITCVTENRPLETVSMDVPDTDENGNNRRDSNGDIIFTRQVVQSGSVRVGAVYGIAAEDSGNTNIDERGRSQWNFPFNYDNWVAGGFSSSPVIGNLGGVEVAYCPAKDGQLYVLKTAPGNLADSARIVWQGPGYINDDPDAPSWAAGIYSGYQGDGYLYKAAVAPGGVETTATWDFDIDKDDQYSFYAWIPPSTSAEVQISDAKYTITIGVTEHAATADQRSGGRWALLGKYDVDSGDIVNVELSSVSESMNDPAAGARYVAADAIKVVPAHLGIFDWSSPIVDGDRVYIGSTSGRLYCFDVSSPNNHDPVWVYPDPNDVDPAKRNPIGEIEASPTLDGSTIYVGSADGHVYAVGTDGKEKWVYPSKTPDANGQVEVLGQISSSIAVYGDKLYFGVGSDAFVPPFVAGSDTAGRIICLDKASPTSAEWIYPDPDPDGNPDTDDGEAARGSFLWSSPLIDINRQTIAIGSSDGCLIGLDLAGNPKWGVDADGAGVFPDLGQEIYSSPAGAMVIAEGIPMAYVGTQGNALHGVDLRDGRKHWVYGLLGAVASSPAIAEERLYVGDMSGITWAFSSRKDSGGSGGMEEWNTDLLPEPPGNIIDPTGEQSAVEVDIFNKDEWLEVTNDAQLDGDLHESARAALETPPFRYEWGETIYVIAWNCLDPNDPTDPDTQWLAYPSKGTKFVPETDSTVRLTIKSRGPGDRSDHSTGPIPMTEKGAIWDDENDRPVFYAKYSYVLGTSSSSNTQAPGSTITMSVQELPNAKIGSVNKGATAGNCLVPEHPIPTKQNPDQANPGLIYDHSKYKPQIVSINNPLGLVHKDASGIQYLIAVDGGMNTSSDPTVHPLVDINGNLPDMPWVRGGGADLVAHGMDSDEREIGVCDRSKLNLMGNRLSKLRVERSDLNWTANLLEGRDDQIGVEVSGTWIPTWLPWEDMPPASGTNASWDYPDIRARQVSFAMTESRLDPTVENADLKWGNAVEGSAAWTVNPTPLAEVISIPRFQPPNRTRPTNSSLDTTGYTGRVSVFIDSNPDGRLNRPGGLGSAALFQQSVTGARAEAYREFYTQVHVQPDYRVEVGEKTYDIGAVPHGFGLTPPTGPAPPYEPFYPVLGDNAVAPLPSGMPTAGIFDQWFKRFTAYNLGNVNLLNVQLAKAAIRPNGDLYTLDLFSDTSDGYIPARTWPWGPGGRPKDWIVSSLDPKFIDTRRKRAEPGNLPPLKLDPSWPDLSRTFHKARVGESPTVLRVQDMPRRMYDGYVPPLPSFSVAVPMGTPVGTYSQTLTLYEDVNNDGIYGAGESIGNPPMEVKVTVTENRLTDGYFPGALKQLDIKENLDTVTHMPIGPQPTFTGDVTPAVYRDSTGNLHMFWSSSRLAPGGTHVAGDPWYLYKSSLPWIPATSSSSGYWAMASPAPPAPGSPQWWTPITTPYPTPTAASLATFFDIDVNGNDKPGDVQLNSVKFSSPSIAQDPANLSSAWLFFGGEANRYQASPEVKAHEYKAFYWLLDAQGNPTGNALSSTRDWTMPKYGIKGAAARINGNPTLWTFWYGGNNSQWRIYYNASPLPGKTVAAADSWSNDGRLSLPRGLVSAAEPSIIPRRALDEDGEQIDALDVVYSAHSQYHKNADIYLSRYEPDMGHVTNGTVELDIVNLPEVREEILTRDPTSAIYSSRHVDWDHDHMQVVVSGPGIATPLTVNQGPDTRDSQTRALIYTYPDASQQTLKNLFRTVVIDPAAGTVKFLRDPGPQAIVTATYRPRAYRLTTDEAADTGPCALYDNAANPRYLLNPAGFYVPSAWTTGNPSVDRLWVLWRRPSTATKGTSIYYKSFRYTIPMDFQVTKNAGDNVSFSPEPKGPVEIDWAKRRLYFTAVDDGKTFDISYPTSPLGATATDLGKVVQLTEELDAHGNSFGNLTSEVANEGQVCALRDPDPYFSKLWVFWTSARAGNTDVYYEAICPRFYAR